MSLSNLPSISVKEKVNCWHLNTMTSLMVELDHVKATNENYTNISIIMFEKALGMLIRSKFSHCGRGRMLRRGVFFDCRA